LSITLPILLVGLEPDDHTPIVDISQTRFGEAKEITGKGKSDNRWRIVNGFIGGRAMTEIGPDSDIGPTLGPDAAELEDAEESEPTEPND